VEGEHERAQPSLPSVSGGRYSNRNIPQASVIEICRGTRRRRGKGEVGKRERREEKRMRRWKGQMKGRREREHGRGRGRGGGRWSSERGTNKYVDTYNTL